MPAPPHATSPSPPPLPADFHSHLNDMFTAALSFVAADRAEPIMRKWLLRHERDGGTMSEERMMAIMADAVLLSSDLLMSQPSASGATAFDRLARNRGKISPEEAAAIAALGKARFRLLCLQEVQPNGEATAQDVATGASLLIADAKLPALPPATHLFGRFVSYGNGSGSLIGPITPLDAAALSAARTHPAFGAASSGANARWAEAVYGHVVRHGTLEIPGLNRLASGVDPEDPFDDIDTALLDLIMTWAALEGAAPDRALLQRTRQMADLPRILDALFAAVVARDVNLGNMADAFEQVLQVQLETVALRSTTGSGDLTLDAIGQAIDSAIALRNWPPRARGLFITLRQRHNGTSRGGDPALDRLVQRIQGLRAKTVAQGCTEQEALSAAAKVAELLDRYGLTLSELDLRAQPCEGIGIQTNRRRPGPIDGCIPSIAEFFDCRVWAERAPGAALRYVFFGLRGDVTAAQYLYEMVERAFDTETDIFRAGDLYRDMAGDRRSATNSFQIGLARGIAGKLHAMREARDSVMRSASGRDLVPMKAAMVDQEMEKLGLSLHRRELGRGKRVLSDAYAAGEEAGQRFEFIPAIVAAGR